MDISKAMYDFLLVINTNLPPIGGKLVLITFTFAICCRPSVCGLSVVGNARAPYSDGCNFRQFFYGIWYIGHPLTYTENFMEIVPGEPLRWGN